jgi:hypothetical protein
VGPVTIWHGEDLEALHIGVLSGQFDTPGGSHETWDTERSEVDVEISVRVKSQANNFWGPTRVLNLYQAPTVIVESYRPLRNKRSNNKNPRVWMSRLVTILCCLSPRCPSHSVLIVQ